VTALDLLPPRWRSDRFLRTNGTGWRQVEVLGDDEGVILLGDAPRVERAVVGRGDAERVGELLSDLARRRDGRTFRWLSVPRATSPGDDVLDALGVRAFSSWDWLAATTPPSALPGPAAQVRRLDLVADAAAIRSCLASSNPETAADPGGPQEAAWFGVEEDGVLVGVIGAGLRPNPDGAHSWELHGLGVRPAARRRGLGGALTAVATAAGLRTGAPWVSLRMYADNEDARRLYERLGYACEARFDTFGPAAEDRPPA
jgi:ribosomal protein S18 acetylase RimI-like enzyme